MTTALTQFFLDNQFDFNHVVVDNAASQSPMPSSRSSGCSNGARRSKRQLRRRPSIPRAGCRWESSTKDGALTQAPPSRLRRVATYPCPSTLGYDLSPVRKEGEEDLLRGIQGVASTSCQRKAPRKPARKPSLDHCSKSTAAASTHPSSLDHATTQPRVFALSASQVFALSA